MTSTLFRRTIDGPRELFYADLYASRRTGCRGQLGMPGIRDQHTGCVGAYLVENDLFDFMLFSLPDNDAWSHKNGPHAQVTSIAAADRQLERLMHAAGGPDQFLEDYAVIVCSDHSQAPVEERIRLDTAFADFNVARPSPSRSATAELALSPAQRSAMIYALDSDDAADTCARARETAREIEGVDLMMWRSDGEAIVCNRRGELHFAPGGELTDARGKRWSVEGELGVLRAESQDGLGNALQEQGIRAGGAQGTELLAQAVAAYRAALEVYTPEAFPADHQRVQANLAKAEGQLKRAQAPRGA